MGSVIERGPQATDDGPLTMDRRLPPSQPPLADGALIRRRVRRFDNGIIAARGRIELYGHAVAAAVTLDRKGDFGAWRIDLEPVREGSVREREVVHRDEEVIPREAGAVGRPARD